jgi:uncharacterized delta-60 repeat protein
MNRFRMMFLEPLEDRRLLCCHNLPPENSIPAEVQETFLNTPLAFTDYRENLISISDPDAGNLEVDVTLTANNGLVSLVNRNLVSTGLTYLAGDGLEDATVKVRGKITEINTALSWVAFTPTPNYTGSEASITITTNDLGNKGEGGAKSDIDTIDITVKALGDLFTDPPNWPTFPGVLDTSFDDDGRRILDAGNTGGSEYIKAMTLLPDGKIVAAGSVDGKMSLLRFTSGLDLDPNFGSGGVVKTTTSSSNYEIMLEVDKEGRLLVAGNQKMYRYLANGSLDTTFGSSGGVTLSNGRYVHGLGIQGVGLQPLVSVAPHHLHQGRLHALGELGPGLQQHPERLIIAK